MKVNLGTLEVSDKERRAVAFHYGEEGLASREMMRQFLLDCGSSDLGTLVYDYEMEIKEEEKRNKLE
jgi:hypothetical protein